MGEIPFECETFSLPHTLIVKVNINNSYLIQLMKFSTLDLRSPLHTFPVLFLPLCSESIVSPSAYR